LYDIINTTYFKKLRAVYFSFNNTKDWVSVKIGEVKKQTRLLRTGKIVGSVKT